MAVKAGSRYEWVRGDYEGSVDTVKEIINGFIIFESNRRCSIDVFEEFLLPYSGSSNTRNKQTTQPQFQNHAQQNQQLQSDHSVSSSRGVTMVQFEQDESNNAGVIAAPVNIKTKQTSDGKFEVDDSAPHNVQQFNQEIKKPEPKVNPITLLINKSGKDECDVPLVYKLKLPKKSVYALLKESFEDVDLDNEILDSILSEIDINEMRELFKKELLEKIKLHYK
jgi:uncharacterized membrane protein YfhO